MTAPKRARTPRSVSREDTTRETKDRPQVWKPPTRLPSFEDFDPDYHYRWVRYELRGKQESANVLLRIREGYEPVRPEEVGLLDHPTIEDGRFEGTVISGDLMLMKIPAHVAQQRRDYYEGQSSAQQKTVDEELKTELRTRLELYRAGKPYREESD